MKKREEQCIKPKVELIKNITRWLSPKKKKKKTSFSSHNFRDSANPPFYRIHTHSVFTNLSKQSFPTTAPSHPPSYRGGSSLCLPVSRSSRRNPPPPPRLQPTPRSGSPKPLCGDPSPCATRCGKRLHPKRAQYHGCGGRGGRGW